MEGKLGGIFLGFELKTQICTHHDNRDILTSVVDSGSTGGM